MTDETRTTRRAFMTGVARKAVYVAPAVLALQADAAGTRSARTGKVYSVCEANGVERDHNRGYFGA